MKKFLLVFLATVPASILDIIWTNTGILWFHVVAGFYIGFGLISVGLLVIFYTEKVWLFWNSLEYPKLQLTASWDEKSRKILIFNGLVFILAGVGLISLILYSYDFKEWISL